jgi:endothelin-converting enzyme
VFGAFNDLAVKNQQLVRELLESDTVPSGADSAADAQLLAKLRGMYGSCMNEDELDRLSSEPLRKVARKIRELYGGKTAIVDGLTGQNKTEGGLTAALAYLHTLGWC